MQFYNKINNNMVDKIKNDLMDELTQYNSSSDSKKY